MQEYGITLSGGTEKTLYSTSFNFTKQNGIIINTGMKNYVGSVNLTQKLGKGFSVNVQANYAEKERNGLQVNYGEGSAAYMYKVWSYRPIDTKGVDLTTELQEPGRYCQQYHPFQSATAGPEPCSGNILRVSYVPASGSPGIFCLV